MNDPKYKNAVRFWERDYNKWLLEEGDRPGPHPNPKSKWNTNPEAFDFEEECASNSKN